MKKKPLPLLFGFAVLCLVGCGQSSPTPPSASGSPHAHADTPRPRSDQAPARRAAEVTYSEPDQAVAVFLQALRDGDDQLAEELLTPKAREETAKKNLAVQPPGTPSATFKIGAVEYLGSEKTGAHVNSTWTEQDTPHGPTTYEIVWALRRQADGWRIAGMATQVTPTDPPIFLNFEDPDDMLEKWRAAEERLAAQHEAELRQAERVDHSPAATSTKR